MARPKTVTDSEIQQAARAVFLKQGPSASVGLIAAELGVSQAALFHRVGSKERLLQTAFGLSVPDVLQRLSAGPTQESAPQDELREILGELLTFFRAVLPGLMVMRMASQVPEQPAGRKPPPVELRRALFQWLKKCHEQGALQVPYPKALAEGLLGALEARCFNAYIGGDSCSPGTDSTFVRDLVRGLVQLKE